MEEQKLKELLESLVPEMRRGTVVLCVLALLKKPTYGYSLVGALEQKGLPVEANTLYPLMRRLEKQGLLQSEWETAGAKPRKYFKTTQAGRALAAKLADYWENTVCSMRAILEGDGDET